MKILEPKNEACNWLSKTVTYHVLIDRFFHGGTRALSHRIPPDDQPVFCGGNLQGVANKLDYLAHLGINAIWLSPFTQTAAYHGYHVTDFFRVETRFGGGSGLRALVRSARAHGIKLIMDFVPNHVHVTHPWFQHARADTHSPYRNWFYWRRNGDYLKFLDFGELPKLNLDHPDARKTIIQAAKFWLDQGLDGFRLDHALGPSLDFWHAFQQEVKRHRPDAALMAEVCFQGIPRRCLPSLSLPEKQFYFTAQQKGFDVLDATMKEYAEVFDGLLDFSFQKLVRTMVAHPHRSLATRWIQQALDDHYARFPDSCKLLTFLDNHDMNRFLFEAGGDKKRLHRALEIQFAQRHPPIIYYGTEKGMNQAGPVWGDHGDLQARRMMAWTHGDPDLLRTCRQQIAKWRNRS
jgi:glycosidase